MAKRAGVMMLLAVAFNTCLVPVRPSPLVSCFATSILELHGNLLPLHRVAFLRDLVGGTHANAIKMRSDQEKSHCAWELPGGSTKQDQRVWKAEHLAQFTSQHESVVLNAAGNWLRSLRNENDDA
jgi:hypothetical protein